MPGYDAAGNMTTMPQPGNETTGLTCVYDAWNRLVEVESGSTVLATYSYDGLNRRITETAGGQTTAYYFNSLPSPPGEGQGVRAIRFSKSGFPVPLSRWERARVRRGD